MPINTDAAGFCTEPILVSWDSKDCLLYALGVGAGATDPESEVEFTTENSLGVDQQVLPTLPVVLAHSAGVAALEGIGPFDWRMLLHGDESVESHGPLPVEGRARVVGKVTGIYDKGSAALVALEVHAEDEETGQRLFTVGSGLMIRGEGGWGGDRGPAAPPKPPDREPDARVTYPTRRDQALLYRLTGDRNPLHSDPAFATKAGFDRPILHGLCTFGFTGRALLHGAAGSDARRFHAMAGRFSNPVQPGDELTVSLWHTGDGDVAFRTTTQTGAVVIDAGRFRSSI